MSNGEFVENGTYNQLMQKEDGVLKKLIREHVEKEHNKLKNDEADEGVNMNIAARTDDPTMSPQVHLTSVELVDQLVLEGKDSFQRILGDPRRMSTTSKVSNKSHGPVPDDAEPMKLVLEDQSIFYKEIPIWSYLKAGSGVVITLIIFAFFFLVHVIRITSGEFRP